jgi:endogenous inhibitor of DNA gyrase (YacG/DUF329 family)
LPKSGKLKFGFMVVKCPTCGKETEYFGNEFRPFCSERCKLIDLGAWADEQYKIPAEELPDDESLSDQTEDIED